MNSRFALLALSVTLAVLSLALLITVVEVTASSVSGEARGIVAHTDIRDGADNRLLAYQRLNINQDEALSQTEPISIFLPLMEYDYIDLSAERAALMALYNSTNGDSWRNNTGWGTDTLYCGWAGVTCDENEHVKILDLDQNWLYGTLPSEIGNLPKLNVLRLTGEMECIKLCVYNHLIGPIPPELGKLVNLQELWLDGNQLTSLPPELGNLASLQVLNLDHNLLSGLIPAFLSNLGNLSWLTLNENPDLTCWETQEARDWALLLDYYEGPTCY